MGFLACSVGSCEVWSACYVFSLWRCPPLCLYPSPQHLVSIPSIEIEFSIKLKQTLWKTKKISFIEAQVSVSLMELEKNKSTFLLS